VTECDSALGPIEQSDPYMHYTEGLKGLLSRSAKV
jgi:hypothetical protein